MENTHTNLDPTTETLMIFREGLIQRWADSLINSLQDDPATMVASACSYGTILTPAHQEMAQQIDNLTNNICARLAK